VFKWTGAEGSGVCFLHIGCSIELTRALSLKIVELSMSIRAHREPRLAQGELLEAIFCGDGLS
jgi:hypothetical protein